LTNASRGLWENSNMSVMQVGLVDTTGNIDPKLVQAAAAALNIQVTRDLPHFSNGSSRITEHGGDGSGFHPAIVRTYVRASCCR
jgi:hypothetical protein